MSSKTRLAKAASSSRWDGKITQWIDGMV